MSAYSHAVKVKTVDDVPLGRVPGLHRYDHIRNFNSQRQQYNDRVRLRKCGSNATRSRIDREGSIESHLVKQILQGTQRIATLTLGRTLSSPRRADGSPAGAGYSKLLPGGAGIAVAAD